MGYRKLALMLVVFGVVFLIGGAYATYTGVRAGNDVKDRIVEQNIVTSADAAIPNELVDDADTAIAQADAIGVHASAAVEEMLGEPLQYAQIPHEDATEEQLAARSLLQTAAGLRSALYGTATAFGLTQLVTFLGIGFMMQGAAMLGTASYLLK